MASPNVAQTRRELHRISAHILGRRRFDVSGRFGLRASPGGIATPAFGQGPEVVRISGDLLVREMGGTSKLAPVVGSTLRDLASFVGVDLNKQFDCGKDGPPVGDPIREIALNPTALELLVDWLDLGWRVLTDAIGDLPGGADPATIQLWPEHFDAGTSFALESGERVNVGFSLGDSFEEEPYVYVGPWGEKRPGRRQFWNAPFGAVLRRSEIRIDRRPEVECRSFLQEGIGLLAKTR